MEYTEEEKKELERQEVEFKRRQDDKLINFINTETEERRQKERDILYGWQYNEPKTTEEWRKLALSLSDSLHNEKKKCDKDMEEAAKCCDEKLNELCSEVDGFARALSYLLSNSVCGQMTHRNRDRMSGHALYAIKCMAEEFKKKIKEAEFSFQLPF
jgi:hypothetical protein